MTLTEIFAPWLIIKRQRQEIATLRNRLAPFARDNDDKPGGRLRIVQPIKV